MIEEAAAIMEESIVDVTPQGVKDDNLAVTHPGKGKAVQQFGSIVPFFVVQCHTHRMQLYFPLYH